MASPTDERGQPRRAARIGFKIIHSPPADLGQLIRRIHIRLAARRRLGREGDGDLPLAGIGNEELRLQIPQPHLGKIKTNLLSNLTSSSRFQHTGERTSEVHMAADQSDLVGRVRDVRRPDYEQPAIAALNQDTNCDRVDLTVRQWITIYVE
jgi:hypothetical protein